MATITDRAELVIGGGVAGPVAAMALPRAGMKVTVFEARERPSSDGGSYLGVAADWIDASPAIDMHRSVRAAGNPAAVIVLVSLGVGWPGLGYGAIGVPFKRRGAITDWRSR